MRNDKPRIYLSVPHMTGHEQKYVREAFRTNWLSSLGPNVDLFEREMEDRLGGHCVALASGTAAIHLGLRLLGVESGDEVLCTSLTFIASASPILYQHATPIFVDSDRRTWNMDPNVLEDALRALRARGKRPKAIIVVDLFGQPADMDPILEIASRYEVPVLEDAANALGAVYKGRHAGTFGAVSALSFNGNKIITTTGGGMLVARDTVFAAKAKFWSTQAREPGHAEYHHVEYGYNYRMSNVCAGIGRGQLQALDERVRQRRAVAARYKEAFADLEGLSLMPDAGFGVHTYWLSVFLVDQRLARCTRDDIHSALAAANIESRPVWKPLHVQPVFHGTECYGGDVALDLFHHGICLPSSSSLSASDQERVIDVVRQAVRGY